MTKAEVNATHYQEVSSAAVRARRAIIDLRRAGCDYPWLIDIVADLDDIETRAFARMLSACSETERA